MTVKNRIVMTPMGTNYGEQTGEMSFSTSTTMSREQRAALVSSSLRMLVLTLRRVQTEQHSFVLIWTITSQDFSSSASVFTSMVHVSRYS